MSAGPAPQMQTSTAAASVATALAEPDPEPSPQPLPETSADAGVILGQVLTALENGGHKMLASTLEDGTVELRGNELVINVPRSAAVIDMMMGPEPKRIANTAASSAAGRALKVNVIGGAAPAKNGNGAQATRVVRNGAGARSRAAEDPIVQRMQEKFGAEIRTVIDHRDKS